MQGVCLVSFASSFLTFIVGREVEQEQAAAAEEHRQLLQAMAGELVFIKNPLFTPLN